MSKYPSPAAASSSLVFPERVTISMASIAQAAQEGLLALAVGAGLQVLDVLMDAEVDAACGPRGRHDADRVAYRHGSEAGSVALGGRRVAVRRPRVRAVDGSGEVTINAYQVFTDTEVLGRLAMEKMLAGCPPAGTPPSGWNQSGMPWTRSLRGQADQRCPAGSWR